MVIRVGLFIGLLFCAGLSSLTAQTKEHVRILYFTGNDVYINLGSQGAIQAGDTLYLQTVNNEEAAYRVLSVSSKRSLVRPVDQVLSLTIGEEVALFHQPSKRAETKALATNSSRTSLFDQEGKKSNKTKKSPIISGRILMGVNSLVSATRWNEHIKDYVMRTSIEPQTGLIINASQLPGDWSVAVNSRLDYRYSSFRTPYPATQLRLYQFQAEKKLTVVPLTLRFGRFYNSNDSFSGFWDGMLMEWGGNSNGVGLILGSEPIRSSETSRFNQPKASFYTYSKWSWKSLQSRTEVAFTHLTPEFGFDHDYIGIREYFRIDKTRINFTWQVDRNPVENNWISSYMHAFISHPLTKHWTVNARLSRREPFRYWSSNPFSLPGYQYGTGITWNKSRIRVGGDWFYHQNSRSNQAQSFNTYLSMMDLTRWNLGWNLSSQFWKSDTYFSIFSSTSVTKQWRSLWLSTGYQFNYSSFFESITHTHGLNVQVQSQIKKLGRMSARFSVDAGPIMLRSQLLVTFWRRI